MDYLGVKNKMALTLNGETITDYEFDHVKESKNSIVLWNDNTIVWYDKKKCKLTKEVNGVSNIVLRNNLFILTYGEYKGANDLDGKTIVLPYKYTEIIPNDYCIEVRDKDKRGAYNYEGKLIMPVNYGSIMFLESGMILSPPDNSFNYYGLYPYDGTDHIISCKYTFTCNYNEDVLIYQDPSADPDNCKSYVIFSHKGKQLGSFKAERGRFYLLDNAIKTEVKNNRKGLISFDGKEIVQPLYDYITDFKKGNNIIYIIDKGDRAGIAIAEKGITIPVEFDEKIELYENYALVRKDNKFALYSYTGEELISLDNHTIIGNVFNIPGIFEVTNNFDKEDKMIYVAPLNKYVIPCHIKIDKNTGDYCYLDDISGEFVKL